MTRPRLIGFGGKLRSGKDTAADRLVAERGFVKVNMSDAIHASLLTMNPIVQPDGAVRYAELTDRVGYTNAKLDPEFRRLMQEHGRGAREVFGPNIWADAAGRRIDELMDSGHDVVLSGVRFPSELELIQSRGGLLLYIRRPNLPESADVTETSVSEDDFDTVIDNSGSLEHLYAQVDHVAGSESR